MAGPSDAVMMIAAVPFFEGLDEKTRKAIAAEGKEVSFKPGEMIVGERGLGVGFYLILDGTAEVRKGGKVLTKLGKGEFFGEMSVIDGQPRSADVVALGDTRCWVLPAWSFSGLIKGHPEVAIPMLKELTKRLRAAQSSPSA
ncbi:MAG: cyclic nucleotide-binding domain-containing protein [Nitrososphaerota archaeon]|nr:cyclic nucleotide-binding domain-containing protein [Nitrososphaerota archaeon]MDG6990132.1 cyclic nucleotide-binding domain-containing protein [Nitrososphaerota archaeon]